MFVPQQRDLDFRPDLEGLRAVAVLLVIGYHARVWGLGGGFAGVDVFFTLSGYLITGLLVREHAETGRISFLSFYARRARRLLPALTVMLIAVMATAAIWFPPLEQVRVAAAALPVAGYFGNFFFLHEATNYFAPAIATSPLLHTWSLAVEEQFYLAWPILVAVAIGRGRSPRRLALAIIGIALASFLVFAWLAPHNRMNAFFGIHARVWEFGAGGLAWLFRKQPGAWRLQAGSIGFAGLCLVIGSAIQFTSQIRFFGPVVLLEVAGTIGILIAGHVDQGARVSIFLSKPFLRTLGRLSYSWYLWHWPMLVFAERLQTPLAAETRLLCVLASLVCAWASYVAVEQPVRLNRRLIARPALSLTLAAILMAAGIGVAIRWRRAAMSNPQYTMFAHIGDDKPRVYELGCRSLGNEDHPRECAFGDESSGTTIVLFGDSHAAQWFSPIETIASTRHWRLLTLLKANCPAVSRADLRQKTLFDDACESWRKSALKRIIALNPALVIIGNSGGLETQPRNGAPKRFSYRTWRDGLHVTLVALNDSHIRSLVIRDTPAPRFDVPLCLARVAWTGAGVCSIPRAEALDESLFDAEKEAAAGLKTNLIDLSDQICGKHDCPAVERGVIVYRDTNHISDSFAESCIEILAKLIETARTSVWGTPGN